MKKILLITLLMPIICIGQDTTNAHVFSSMRSCGSYVTPYSLQSGYVCYNQINDSTFQFEVLGDTLSAINKLLIKLNEYEDKYYAAAYLIEASEIKQTIGKQKRSFGNTEWVKHAQRYLNEYNKVESKYRNIYKNYRKREQLNQ